MDTIKVATIVKKKLEQQDIKNGNIYILEKEWGYVVQIEVENYRNEAIQYSL